MFSFSRYGLYSSSSTQVANLITLMEWTGAFSLIIVGVLWLLNPLAVGIAVTLALLSWIIRWCMGGQPMFRTFISGPLVMLVISALIGVGVSYDRALSWPLFLTLLGSIRLFVAIAHTNLPPRWVGGGLVIAASLLAFYFVGQYGYFYYPYEWGVLPRLGRITGSALPNLVFFTPHPNAVAGFLESVWLLGLVLAWEARRGVRIVWVLGVIIISYSLLISESRGAWLGLTIVLGVGAWLLIPERRLRLALGRIGLITITLSLLGFFYLVSSGLQIPLVSPTLDTAYSRLVLYRNSLNLWSDYPFTGIGLGDTFAFVYSRYQLLIPYRYLSYAHNLFLSVGLSLGVLGLLALIWLLISFYRFVIRVETKGNLSPQALSLFRAAWLGVSATFVHGLTDAPQFAGSGWTMPMLFAMLGLTIAAGQPALSESEYQKVTPALFSLNPWGWLALGGVVGILLGGLLVLWRPLVGAWYANWGALHQTQAELSPDLSDSAREATLKLAVADFTQALHLSPLQPVANRRLGLIALEQQNFETAVIYLEQAYQQEPQNQATLKGLGLAYLWTGHLTVAQELLRQIDNRWMLIEELRNWRELWRDKNKPDLATYAQRMAQFLVTEP